MDGVEIAINPLRIGWCWSRAKMNPHRVALYLLSLALSACAAGPARSLIPLPPSPGTAVAPTAPSLVVRLDYPDSGSGFADHVADYLSDGTIIRASGQPFVPLQYGDPPRTLEINKLTAAGLAKLHALLAADADLLAQPRDIKEQLLPNRPQSGRGPVIDMFVLSRPDGSRYAVTVPSLTSADAGNWAPDPAITRLSALAETIADPTTMVGAASLASPVWATYQPAQAALFIRSNEVTPAALADMVAEGLWPMMDPSHWPFEGAPGTFGTTFTSPHGPEQCTFLPTTDAMAALTSLPGGVARRSLAASGLGAGTVTGSPLLLWSTQNLTESFSLSVVALLPEDVGITCLDVLTY